MARRAAWARFGWVFWPVFIFGPVVPVVAALAGGWSLVAWVGRHIPEGQHGAAALIAAAAVVFGIALWRAGIGSWVTARRRAIAVWGFAAAGVLLLAGAAYAASGR